MSGKVQLIGIKVSLVAGVSLTATTGQLPVKRESVFGVGVTLPAA